MIRSLLGIAILVAMVLYFQLGEKKKGFHINVKSAILCITIQILLAIIFLKIPAFSKVFSYITAAFQVLQQVTEKAVGFVFGGLSNPPQSTGLGYIFCLQALPLLITVSTISSVLMYTGVLPAIVKGLSWSLRKITKISFGLSIGTSTSFFAGSSENALVLRHYLPHFSSHEILTIMVLGISTVSISMLAVLDAMYGAYIPSLMQYMVTAMVLNIFGALWIVGPIGHRKKEAEILTFDKPSSLLEAISQGIMAGARVVAIIAVLIVGFLSLLYLVDAILSVVVIEGEPLTLARILGWLLTPIAWLIGADSPTNVAHVIGIKIALNEVLAYKEAVNLMPLLSLQDQISTVFCISNFANVGTITSVVGTYSALLPNRSSEMTQLASRAFLLALLNTFFTAICVRLVLSS